MSTIPYGRQSIDQRDIQAVLKTLNSDWISQGPKIHEFERAIAKYCGSRYAVVVSSGTAALHLAYAASGIRPGDEVITSPLTFVATAHGIVNCGGAPVFADIDAETLNLNPTEIVQKISSKTKAIAPVHFAGHPCRVQKIREIAQEMGAVVIEDGAHALGARYRIGRRWYQVGSCSHSDACTFSFHPVKAITTGEGGAITTNREDIYERLMSLRTHGVIRDKSRFKNMEAAFVCPSDKNSNVPWYYEVQSLGFNYRLTDFQSALGIQQLSRIQAFIQRRREIAEIYRNAFKNVETVVLPNEEKDVESAYHLYILQLRLEKLRKGHFEIFRELRKGGLEVQVHYVPVHYFPFYQEMGYRKGDFPVTEAYYERAFSIPIFASITSAQIKKTIKTIIQVLSRATIISSSASQRRKRNSR